MTIGARPHAESPAPDAAWPTDGGTRSIVLEFASTPVERDMLDAWLARMRPDTATVDVVPCGGPELARALRSDDGSSFVAPVRVAWLPRERGGVRAARVGDLLALRNPRRPTEAAQRRIVRREPDRCQVVVGEPARVDELRARFDGEPEGLAPFVERQAVLALDRAGRSLFGTQYKVPRFVSEEIAAGARFGHAVRELAERLERPAAELRAEAAAYIDEMVAAQSRLAIDIWGQFGRWLSRAYTVDVDRSRLDELRRLGERHPLVFLPSHRSYLDPLVLRTALHTQGFPPNHVLGGINVAFWPIGPVARRSGYVFIRRSFRDNPVYKLALREYMGFLMRKRFNLEWYIEGGRSRTGKLRPPRFGLLSYLVEAFDGGGVDDVQLVPVSIVYDQLYEVGAMAAEERGGQKTAEGLGWLVGYARAQGRGLGKVHVSIGEPLSLRAALTGAREEGEGSSGGRRDSSLEKVAFEVCHRIGRATPVTPTSLVTLALLGVEDRALTLREVRALLEPLLDYVEQREFPTTGDLDLRRGGGVRRTLDALCASGVVTCFADGLEPVWHVCSDRHLEAAFYRNSAVHFFVNRAIAELVLASAADAPSLHPQDEAWEEALRLRDLLKFEFFFGRKREFALEIRDEMAIIDPDWEQKQYDPDAARRVLEQMPLHLAHRVLRPFLEAYGVVADRLADRDPRRPVVEKEFLAECAGVAGQYRLQRRLHSPESISHELFRTALRLAANRDLVDPGREELAERRRAFAEEVSAEVRRIGSVRDAALLGLEPTGEA